MYEDYLTSSLVGVINAKQALKNYEATDIRKLKNTAAYNVQQSIEFLLKHQIYNCAQYNQGSDRVTEIFSHDLDMLIQAYCIPFQIRVPKKIIKNARMYSTWEAESRYKLTFSVKINSLITAIEVVESWLIEIKPSYKNKLLQVNDRLGF